MSQLKMERYHRMMSAAVSQAAADGGAPFSVAVCNGEGILIGLLKMDGAATRTARQAQLKAYTAARMQATSGSFAERIKREGIDVAYFCDPQLMPFPGGAPIFDADGTVIGSVGISGRVSEEDQEIALRLARME